MTAVSDQNLPRHSKSEAAVIGSQIEFRVNSTQVTTEFTEIGEATQRFKRADPYDGRGIFQEVTFISGRVS
jgi:hypothetical protein